MEENQVEETNIPDVSKCPNEEVLENHEALSNRKLETVENLDTPEISGLVIEKYHYKPKEVDMEDDISSEENNETYDDNMDFYSASESLSSNEPNLKKFDSDADEPGEFRCPICNLKKKTYRHLQRHILLHDPKVTMYSCDLCDYKTNNMKYLNRHDYKHKESSEVIIYKCQFCSFETQHKRSLKGHQVVHKGPSALEVYKCGLCSYKTKDNKSLKLHMRDHNKNFKKPT